MTSDPSLERRLALLDVDPNDAGRKAAQVRVAAVPARRSRRRRRLGSRGIAAIAALLLVPLE